MTSDRRTLSPPTSRPTPPSPPSRRPLLVSDKQLHSKGLHRNPLDHHRRHTRLTGVTYSVSPCGRDANQPYSAGVRLSLWSRYAIGRRRSTRPRCQAYRVHTRTSEAPGSVFPTVLIQEIRYKGTGTETHQKMWNPENTSYYVPFKLSLTVKHRNPTPQRTVTRSPVYPSVDGNSASLE